MDRQGMDIVLGAKRAPLLLSCRNGVFIILYLLFFGNYLLGSDLYDAALLIESHGQSEGWTAVSLYRK
jgi:hypothetical protein